MLNILENSAYDFLTIFLVGFFSTLAIILTKRYHLGFTAKGHSGSSIQSAHKNPTPRVGGIAIAIAFGFGLFHSSDNEVYKLSLILGVSALPVFLGGLGEDIGKDIRPRVRLVLSFVSAAVAFLLFGFGIGRIGISSIDVIIAIPVISFVFTVLVSGGICHATNLIDGLHGLAIGVSVVMLLGLASISVSVNDMVMARICLGGVACLLGLLVFNFPLGKVFLGDAGAYSIGHVIAWIGVLIIARNPSVAPFSVLLVFFWPLTEMTFAIVRRKLNGKALSSPDRLHFHQLIMRGLEILLLTRKRRNVSNPAASLIIVGLSSAPVFVAQNLSQENVPAFFAFIGFAVLFVGLYLIAQRFLTHLR